MALKAGRPTGRTKKHIEKIKTKLEDKAPKSSTSEKNHIIENKHLTENEYLNLKKRVEKREKVE